MSAAVMAATEHHGRSESPIGRFVSIPGSERRIHVLEWNPPGAQSTMLCVHGGCANAYWWLPSASTLGANHHIVAVDLCGHGESDRKVDSPYSLESHAADVVAVANELKLPAFTLIGHSFGAFVSLAALSGLGPSVAKLVLVDSRGHIRRRTARYMNALSKFPHPKYATRDEALDSFQLLPRATSASAEVLRLIATHSIREQEDGTWALAFDRRALRRMPEREFAAELRDLSQPTLLVRGELSTALTERGLASLAAEIPHAQCAVVAGAHHHVMLDRPEEFAKVIDRFAVVSSAGVDEVGERR